MDAAFWYMPLGALVVASCGAMLLDRIGRRPAKTDEASEEWEAREKQRAIAGASVAALIAVVFGFAIAALIVWSYLEVYWRQGY